MPEISQNMLSNALEANEAAQCKYCKATGHFWKSCPKQIIKREMADIKGQTPHRPTYPESTTCRKTNHLAEICWKGTGAHLCPEEE